VQPHPTIGMILAVTIAAATAPVARAQAANAGGASCAVADRVVLDIGAWRKQVMRSAGDRDALAPLLARAGLDLAAFRCLPGGKVIAVDVFRATFGAVPDADRIVQTRTQGCLLDRDFVILTRSPDGSWCVARGDMDKGISINGCSYAPPLLALVHLTDPRRQTVRVDASHGQNAVSESGERVCYREGVVQFWDVEPGRLIFRLEVPAGPITLSGGYPKDVRALDDMQKPRTYRLAGERYEAVDDSKP